MVTDCAEEYVPAAGANVGAAACEDDEVMTYAAAATALAVMPLAVAMALMVSLAATWMAEENAGEAAVGVEPSEGVAQLATKQPPPFVQSVCAVCAVQFGE